VTTVAFLLSIVLGANLLFYLVYGIASRFEYNPKKHPLLKEGKRSFLIIVPAFKEDDIVVAACKHNLQTDYPKDKFNIVVLAQLLQSETLGTLRGMGCDVIDIPVGPNHSKIKAMKMASAHLDYEAYDYVMILDSDNELAPDALHAFSDAANRGFEIIQGRRQGKPDGTELSWFDEANEALMHNFYRKGHRVLNVASSLSGTGMCFASDVYPGIIHDVPDVSGEDKFMELGLMKKGFTVEFREDAELFELKTNNDDQFVKQRTRWIAAQFYALKYHFFSAFGQFFKTGNWNYLDKALELTLIPKSILILILPLFVLFTLFVGGPYVWISTAYVVGMLFSVYMALPAKYRTLSTLKHLFQLPKMVWLYVLAFLNIKSSTVKNFEVTEKNATK
jgi:cellulose synthase/poly-beta-1,6-N-acetylglucosamine synthase-like glycosyltransferase